MYTYVTGGEGGPEGLGGRGLSVSGAGAGAAAVLPGLAEAAAGVGRGVCGPEA